MNRITDFLGTILPEDGRYCVVGINNGKLIKQEFVDDLESVADKADKLVKDEVDAYYAVASFKEGVSQRTQSNVAWVKSFWLDIDCGEGKPYANQQEGLEALNQFRETTKLPEPYIVNSGNGLHIYWLLDRHIESADWSPVAKRLKQACGKFGLEADPSVTADEARILRVPYTLNFKDREHPKDVLVQTRAEPVKFEDFKGALDALDMPVIKTREKLDVSQMSDLAKAMMGNKQSRFSTIVRKSVKGGGCNAIKHIVTKQDDTDEPLWRAGLSIAWCCVDRETAIHKMSSKHPDYSPEVTIEKASLTKGPYTCETFKRDYPDLCEGCTLSITSPIQIGAEIARAPEVIEGDGSIQTQVTQSIAFKPPFPYFRGKNGGIYIEGNDADGEKIDELVYDHDLFASARLMDPNDGECIVWHLTLPMDGEREFLLPLADMTSPDGFKKVLGKRGVAANKRQWNQLMDYTIRYTRELQMTQKAQDARLQFGWNTTNTEFTVGDRVYVKGKTEPEHNYASSTTANIIKFFDMKGSLSDWTKMINRLNVKGDEALQIHALAGFAAPLMKFSGIDGCVINLVSNKSGTGKTTAGKIGLSVFGNPKRTILTKKDTQAAKYHRMGVMNNLFVLSDEMTNATAEEISDEIYGSSQGRGRNRMNSNSNTERENSATWATIHGTSSNASFMDKLSKHKARADGEMMRLIEYKVKSKGEELYDPIFDMLETESCYGVAGHVWAQWLVDNADTLHELVIVVRTRLRKRVGHNNSERFYINGYACIIAAGKASRDLGLHCIDMEWLEDWICEEIVKSREIFKDHVVDPFELIVEFLNRNLRNTAVIGANKNPLTGDESLVIPMGASCNVRFEQETSKMFIAARDLHDFCVDQQMTFEEVLNSAMENGGPFKFVKRAKKRMLAKTKFKNVGAINALEFDLSPEEVDNLLENVMAQDAQVESESDD
jgi:hypothetical protein